MARGLGLRQGRDALAGVLASWGERIPRWALLFNLLDPRREIVDERVIEQRANARMLSLRTGCLCNPGAREAAFQLPPEVLAGRATEPRRGTREHCSTVLGLASVVRVSLGVATNFADVYRFVQFARSFLDTAPTERDLPPRRHC